MINLDQIDQKKIDILNKKILDSILDDDDEQFSQLISQIGAIDSNPNQPFQLTSYKLPAILSASPPYACLCAFFSAQKCFESLTILISEGLNSKYFKKRDSLNRSLIHFACAGGNLSIIREIEQAGFDINIQDNLNKTPSHYSAMFNRIEALQFLWTKGADILQMNSKLSPIHEACEYGNLGIIKFICENVDKAALSKGYEKSKKNKGNSLHLACQGGHLNVVNYILSDEILANTLINDVDDESRTPLICACENGSLECVKALVKFGKIQFNNIHRKKLPLIEAAANGHSDIVNFLLKQKDCDINATNSNKLTALDVAIINGRFEIVEILIQNGAIENLNETEIGNLFLDACGTFNIDMIKFLDKILNVPYKTMGETFMKQACKIENENLVNFLLDKNCKLNNNALSSINFRSKWTPFMSFLKSKGADFSHLELSSGDLLIVHSIRECASFSTVKKLISEGVVINEKIISENNLIFCAAQSGRVELFNYLSSFKPELKEGEICFLCLEYRIKESLKNKQSKFYNGCLEIAESLLKDYNVNPNDTDIVSSAFASSLLDVIELLSKYNSDFSNIRINCRNWSFDYDPNFFGENLVFLKSKNFDINQILSNNSDPIIVEGVKTSSYDVVKDLISKGFELNAKIISNYDLVYDVCIHKNIDLFNLLISFKPEIKALNSCLLMLFTQLKESKFHKKNIEFKNCLEMIETLFTQYKINPNNEIFINYAVRYKIIDVLDLLIKSGVDFNCCYIDYSELVSHDHLEVFLLLEKNGCLFQKAKHYHSDLFILPYTKISEKETNLFKKNIDEEYISPIQENINSIFIKNYDINTLLFLLKYASNDDIIKLSLKNKNIIDVLLDYKCYNEIINIFAKLNKILLPNAFSVEKFKVLISENVNMTKQTNEVKLLINSLLS